MIQALLAVFVLSQVPKNIGTPGKDLPQAATVQGCTNCKPIAISGTVNSAGAADTVGASAALGALDAVCSVAMAGQQGVGMRLEAGTLAATLTPEYSLDGATTWTATKFVDAAGATSSTLAFTNPNAATQSGIVVVGGASHVRVRVSSYTSGTANCRLRAATAESSVAAGAGGGSTQYDEDTASASGQSLTMAGAVRRDTAVSSSAADGDRVDLSADSSGRLRVTSADVTQPVSGTVTVTDGAGALNVIVDSSALPSGASTAAKQPALGTAGTASADVLSIQGIASMTPLQVADNGGSLTVDGTVTVTDGAGALNVIVDSSATVTVTDGAGAMNVIVDSIAAGNNNIGDVDVASMPNVTVGTFPDNEPINVAQLNGVAVTMGNGASGTGVQRVTIASDSTGQVAVASLPNEGQQTAANSISVTPDTDNDAIGATAAAVPGEAMYIAGTDGTNVTPYFVDACEREAKTVYVVNISTATTTEIANQVASEFFHICSINLVAAAAQTIAVVEDDTDACASPTAGLNGGTTAATGWSFAANGGIALGNGESTVMKTATANRYFCLITGQAAQISGTITYVSSP
jgi:hypothetical protein